MKRPIKIMIVEDEKILREGLAYFLQTDKQIQITGSYGMAEDALLAIDKEQPDIVITDLGLPGISGVDFIRQAKEIHPDAEFIPYTILEDRDNVFAAFKAGATGYLLKGNPTDVLEGIYTLAEGGAPMSPEIARKVITSFAGTNTLADKELQALVLIKEGNTYKTAADLMDITVNTFKTYLRRVYEKLHVQNKQEAIMKAKRMGIL